jgi:hypothetical protein
MQCRHKNFVCIIFSFDLLRFLASKSDDQLGGCADDDGGGDVSLRLGGDVVCHGEIPAAAFVVS